LQSRRDEGIGSSHSWRAMCNTVKRNSQDRMTFKRLTFRFTNARIKLRGLPMTARAVNIKNYLTELFVQEDDVLQKIRARSKEAGLPAIEVPATVGKLLYCLAKIQKPQRILEIGTLAGYSTIWLARALPATGKLISLELEKLHAVIARENMRYAGLSDK